MQFLDPPYEDVTWHEGSDGRVSRYRFNTKTRDHMFCPRCGTSIGIDFFEAEPKRYGISVSFYFLYCFIMLGIVMLGIG